MSTAFDRLLGDTQGRIDPRNATAAQGDFVFALGSDTTGVKYTFNLNDNALLQQQADVTGVNFIRFSATLRPPKTMPAGTKWQLQWGLDGTVHGYRDLVPGRTLYIRDGVISTTGLSGNHNIRFRLKLVAA